MKNEKKAVYCQGKIAGTTRTCRQLLYHSDGQFLYINDFILNPEDEVQVLICACGKKNFWKRNSEFAKPSKKRAPRIKRDNFPQKFKNK